jgi:hypothetical protein
MTTMLAAAVLVELFTSEGCSSCPPADAVLARLNREQPVPGVQLVVLSEHVDYWNDQGWKDPFSDARFSDRQGRYGSRVYTPQVVVDGHIDVLGSDEGGIVRAAKAAARDPHGTVRLDRSPAGLRISVSGLSGHRDARVMLAVVEDNLVSRVEHGENAGRTLSHTAVARVLREVGRIPATAAQWSAEVPVPTDVSWKQTRVIAFVQDGATRRVLASGALQEQRDSAPAERHQRAADDEAHGPQKAHAP